MPVIAATTPEKIQALRMVAMWRMGSLAIRKAKNTAVAPM